MGMVIFWGTGKIGRSILQFWKEHYICPDFFCDTAEELWGRKIDGISVISPKEVYNFEEKTIYITCSYYDAIYEELIRNGIKKKVIVRADTVWSPEMSYRISDALLKNLKLDVAVKRIHGCMVDLVAGMILGGVERWSYSFALILKRLGLEGAYLVPGFVQNTVEDHSMPSIYIGQRLEKKEMYYLDSCMEAIAHSGYDTIICNFPLEIFVAACVIKKCLYPELRIIAVLHNDEEIYYRAYGTWSEYIDTCLVISKKMKTILINRGFPAEKIRTLYWKIPCAASIERNYSGSGEKLRIGYAGRLEKHQKRLDLLIEAAEKLEKQGINYILEMAGIGNYEDMLRTEIIHRRLEKNVILKGLIDHRDIAQFWIKQDIYLSCSDWEGHSISQSEAMAAGAVPVVTNTSGAEDDIRSGYNGYIVEVGDIDGMVQHIKYLSRNRELLSIMGRRSHNVIWERNQVIDEETYWRELLERG